jgi:hypothetical protein
LNISNGEIRFLRFHKINLKGDLKLSGFTNLTNLNISHHSLCSLDLSDSIYLTQLNCSNNELNSLKISECLNLENLDISRNKIRNLDLKKLTKLRIVNFFQNNYLEDVDISNCKKLTEIGLGFARRDNKLIRITQVKSASDEKIRNILIFGITGNGKSSLANVLVGENKFKEGSSSLSITKNFQSEIVNYKEIDYRIIDNVGLADANISREDILFRIGEGICEAKEGLNQVIFVFKSRFGPDQILAFNHFKELISEAAILKFTTLVRTHFENFTSQEKCDEDKKLLSEENLVLSEILSSCHSLIHVDNQAEISDEEDDIENEFIKEKREKSRKVLFDHLTENCNEVYKLKEWDSIYNQVGRCIERIKEIEIEISESSDDSEKDKLRKIIKSQKREVVEQVDVNLGFEISASPKVTVGTNLKNIKFSNLWKAF